MSIFPFPPTSQSSTTNAQSTRTKFVEVIDFSRLVENGDAGGNKTEEKKEEDKEQKTSGGDNSTKNSLFTAEDELIEKLEEQLRLFEVKYKAAKDDSKKEKAKRVLSPKAPPATSNSVDTFLISSKPKQFSKVETKLCLGVHQLPLPSAFNRLALVEQSLLLAPIPDSVRGQYLNLCWEEQFYAKLDKAANDTKTFSLSPSF